MRNAQLVPGIVLTRNNIARQLGSYVKPTFTLPLVSSFQNAHTRTIFTGMQSSTILSKLSLVPLVTTGQPNRSVTKFSRTKGKRKTVKAVIKRFKRLDWGAWIRTHSGRHKKMWKKSGNLKRRLRQHIFVNSTQSYLLEKMVTKFWRRPRHYINDPYEPYHKREEYSITKSKPRAY